MRHAHRVLIGGLPYFANMLAALLRGGKWDVRSADYTTPVGVSKLLWSLATCDLVYKIGGRVTCGKFLRAARLLGKDRVVMHWVGSDVLHAQRSLREGKLDSWVEKGVRHWAEVPWIAQEVRELGLHCDVVPLASTGVPVKPVPLPAQFTVLVYAPELHKAERYGLDIILRVVDELPSVRFLLVGVRGADTASGFPPNLKALGWQSNLMPVYERTTVLWRPTRHDGLSFMVLEALACGRYVLWSYEFPGCIRVSSAVDACRELQRLHALHEEGVLPVNQTGSQIVAEQYHPSRVKDAILKRFADLMSLVPAASPSGIQSRF